MAVGRQQDAGYWFKTVVGQWVQKQKVLQGYQLVFFSFYRVGGVRCRVPFSFQIRGGD
jgi:membrane-anchored glycerophosphoryl diester phosphodiesterase (GDPDase)